MSTQTQVKLSPIQRIDKLIKTQSWVSCNTEVKRIYQLIKSQLSATKQADVLIWIYNNINDTQYCDFSITEFWHFMNN